jgi:excisionase family DNA binding protein
MTTTKHGSDGWPDFLTVEQAAVVLRIGRTAAYELARRYLDTDGAEGLPVIRIGKQLRVPRPQLERWHGGPLTPPTPPETAGERNRMVLLGEIRRVQAGRRRVVGGRAGLAEDSVERGSA